MRATLLKNDEQRRLARSAGWAALFYLIFILIFSLYLYWGSREVAPYGASAIYLDITQVSQAPVQEENANPGGRSSTPTVAEKQINRPVKRAAAAAESQRVKTPVATENPVAVQENWEDDFFSDMDFSGGEAVSASSGSDYESVSPATTVNDSFLDSSDYDRLDEALSNAVGSGDSQGGELLSNQSTAASGLTSGDSTSTIDLAGLTAKRRLVSLQDPDFSGVDTAGRRGFSFIIAFDLHADGTLSRVMVVESSGSPLADRRMEQALRQWRFAHVANSTTVHVRLKYYVSVR